MNIAQENKFYEVAGLNKNEIEHEISRLEADVWSPAYSELIVKQSFESLSSDSKDKIFHFLAFQLIRTKAEQIEMVNMYNTMINKIREVHGNSLLGLKMIEEQEKVKKMYLDSIYNSGINKALDVQAKRFGSKEWVVLLNQTDNNSFLISDNPIAFANSIDNEDKGFMRRGAKIFFPLTSKILLYSFDEYSKRKNDQDIMDHSEIDEANEAQVRSSTRYIYRTNNDFQKTQFYLSKYPILKKPGREFDVTVEGNKITWKYKRII
jgi:hypothetical protein